MIQGYRLTKIPKLALVAITFITSSLMNVYAYETDQYSTMFYEIPDSTKQLDMVVNNAIKHVVYNWNKERNDYKLLSRVSGFFHSRQLEKWISDSKSIEKRNIKSDSIFKTTGWKNSFIIRWKGLAPSFTLNNVQIGSDKLSHFFGVGWIYWKKSEVENAGESEDERRMAAIDEGLFTEETYWGQSSTNVFSNADLVANWEGYMFFRSMLEDNIVDGKKAIIRWDGDTPIIQREFTFKDHVNDFWNEALLPNHYDSSLSENVKNVLMTYCDRPYYRKNTSKWKSQSDNLLWKKYNILKLKKDAIKYRMDNVCADYAKLDKQSKKDFLSNQNELENEFREGLDDNDNDNRSLDIVSLTQRAIEMIESPVPTCDTDINKARNEHVLIEEFYREHSDSILKVLKQVSKKIDYSKIAASKGSSATEFYTQIFVKNNKKKLRKTNFDNLVLRRLKGKLKTKKPYLKVTAEYSNYGKSRTKMCILYPIPLSKSSKPVRHDFVKISMYHCAYIDNKSGKIEFSRFWRAYDKKFKLRSSMRGYYDILDQEAYIYRMIPKYCKWY